MNNDTHHGMHFIDGEKIDQGLRTEHAGLQSVAVKNDGNV
jgi:hypothetical protein